MKRKIDRTKDYYNIPPGRISTGFLPLLVGIVPLAVNPFLSDAFSQPKWLLIHCVALILLLGKMNGNFRKVGVPFFMIGVGVFLPYFSQPLGGFEIWVGVFFSLGVVALGIGTRMKSEPKLFAQLLLANRVSLLGVLLFAFAQRLGWAPYPLIDSQRSYFDSTFGHESWAAQFVGLSVLFLVVGTWPRSRWHRVARVLLISVASGYLFSLGNRSSLLALFLTLLLTTFAIPRFKKGVALFLLMALMSGGSLFAFREKAPALVINQQGFWEGKKQTAALRLVKGSNAVALARHFPLGVGVGNLSSIYLAWNRSLTPDLDSSLNTRVISVENDFFDLLITFGWLVTLVVVWGVGKFYLRLVKFALISHSSPALLAAAGLTYFFVAGFFSFPSRNPSVALWVAILFGVGFSVNGSVGKPWPLPKKFIFVIPVLYSFLALAIEPLTKLSFPQKYTALKIACLTFPAYREYCAQQSRFDEGARDYPAARATLQKMLHRDPHDIDALKVLFRISQTLGERESSCLYARQFANYFPESNDVRSWQVEFCP